MTAGRKLGPATLVGARAHAFASLAGRSGTVLTVVSKTAYLQAGDEIFWLGQSANEDDRGVPPHSRAILGGFDLSPLSVGMPFQVTPDGLLFGRRHLLVLADAPIWRPLQLRRPAPRAIVEERQRRLLREVQVLDCTHGLGGAIPLLSDVVDGRDSMPPPPADPFLAAALPPIRQLAVACRERDAEGVLSSAPALIGLGAGLTPSGDDLVGGCLFALHHICIACPELFPAGPVRPAALLAHARDRTNGISYTLVYDHARGEGAEPLHRLMLWLLDSQGMGGGKPDLAPLLSIGSTSGRDLLAGLLAGMLWFGGNDDLTTIERESGSEVFVQEGYGHTACH